MKRILFVLALIVSAEAGMAHESVRVTTKDGIVMAGTFVDGTDSTYTIKCSNDIRTYVIEQYGTDTITFQIANIYEVSMYGKVLVPQNGKLTAIKPQEYTKKQQPNDPNYVIGKALKSTGSFAMGVGIPCLIAGTILTAVGSADVKVDLGNGYMSDKEILNKLTEISNKQTSKGKMLTAGCVLLPIGASLTIVGIPLHVHGKKIMTMNFNYTGNGVGVGLEF